MLDTLNGVTVMAKITRQSMLTGVLHTMELPVTMHQYTLWEEGMLIQDAMPNLSADEREFIMTGITPEEWDAEFNELDETYEDHYV
jgi:hypothetical protein